MGTTRHFPFFPTMLFFCVFFLVSVLPGPSPPGGCPAASQPPPQPPLGAPPKSGTAGPHPHPRSRSDNCEAVYVSIFRLLYILFEFSRTPGSLYNCGAGFPIFGKKLNEYHQDIRHHMIVHEIFWLSSQHLKRYVLSLLYAFPHVVNPLRATGP